MIHHITSRTNPRIKELLNLQDPKYRKEKQLFAVEGFHLLTMALDAQAVVLVVSDHVLDHIPEKIDQLIVSYDILKKISHQITPQGVYAVCRMSPQSDLYGDRILLLDQISDPGNLGTLMRTAVAFGFQDIVLTNGTCSPYNEKVITASQGAIFALRLHEAEDAFLSTKKQEGYCVWATSLTAAKELATLVIPQKIIVILGNEAHGVSSTLLTQADESVIIPIATMESLNVAVAGGIICYDIYLRGGHSS